MSTDHKEDALLLATRNYQFRQECMNGIIKNWFPVFVKYPVNPVPRYGYGRPANRAIHDILDRDRIQYKIQLQEFARFRDQFNAISETEQEDSHEPCWSNPWFSGLDAIALYSFLAMSKPSTYLEIGSGNSTKFAHRAIRDHNLNTSIISIDPHPRAEVDAISDIVHRQLLQDIDLSVFDCLKEGDILFFDGSHCCFMNSDVAVFFLEVLPRIPAGVLIHIHDIHLPNDYPPERARHYESEQYLLAALLLAEGVRYRTILPNTFIVNDNELCSILDPVWSLDDAKIQSQGVSFWLDKTDG